jgi:protocatechuate 3,4-dioxygenase beta subunit
MRPVVVLSLVLGAIAALTFAVLSITETSRGTDTPLPPIVGPAAAPSTDTTANVEAPVSPREPVAASLDEDRTGIKADLGAEGGWNGNITGRVLDGVTGAPVVGARVNLIRQDTSTQVADMIRIMNNTELPKPVRTVESDADGSFSFELLRPSKDWALYVIHPDYLPRTEGPITLGENDQRPETVLLFQGPVFEGDVVAEVNDLPIAGAKVELFNNLSWMRPPGPGRRSDSLTTTTLDDGTFRIVNVPPLSNRCAMVSAKGFATLMDQKIASAYPPSFASGPRQGLVPQQPVFHFKLAAATVIAGRVLGPDRRGIAGVHIEALSWGDYPSHGETQTQEGGEFLLEDLAAGKYTLTVDCPPGYEEVDRGIVQNVDAGVTDLEILLAEKGTILGHVVDGASGQPVKSFKIAIRQVNQAQKNPVFGSLVSERVFNGTKDGSFSIADLPSGTLVVQADAQGYASSFSEAVSVEQGLTTPDVVVHMRLGAKLAGQLIDAGTGEPVSGAQVATFDDNHIESDLFKMFDAMAPSAISKVRVTTDEEGRFLIERLTPEAYQIQISKPGFTTLTTNGVRLLEGVTNDLGIVRLSAGAVIRGTVYGPDGEPLPGSDVILRPAETNKPWGAMSARTDATGRYVLSNAAPGNYKLAAKRPTQPGEGGFGSIVDIKNSEVLLTLAEGGEYTQDLYLGKR